MPTVPRKRMPPFWSVILMCFLLYGAMSIGLTPGFGLPWWTPIPFVLGLAIGVPLLALGAGMYVWSDRSLGIRRALGKELFKPAAESTLVKTGAFAHSRNPLYFSATLLLLGLFCVSHFTPIAILTVLAFVHFVVVAKWEERELTQRFGKAYLDYKQRVPFFIPRLRPEPGEDCPAKGPFGTG